MTGEARHHDARDPELLGDRHGVHRSRAAEAEEGEVAGVEPAVHRDFAHRPRHLRDRDPERRAREIDGIALAFAPGRERLERRARLLRGQHEPTRERPADRQAA